ncbi:DNA-processing protein DprA [Microbacterium lacticum]
MADAITSLAKDERTARVMLAMGSEPGDSMTGRLLRTIGATATVGLATSSRSVRGVDRVERELWQRRLASRLSAPLTRSILDDGERLGLGVLIPGDEAWPKALADLGDHAPFALWTKGDKALLAAPIQGRVAITGARAATGYGEHVATELALGLVRDHRQIVSGGAYGIDAAAHRAALAAEAPTIAVMPGGLDRLYPAGNQDLLERVAKSGLLVSEMPPRTAPTKWRFLQRNRVLAALSGAVVVVEAGYRSGSLNTASHAAALGRPVGAVPGPVTSPASAGCHRLIREGVAGVVTDVSDIDALLQRGAGSPGRGLALAGRDARLATDAAFAPSPGAYRAHPPAPSL